MTGIANWNGNFLDEIVNGNQNMVDLAQPYLSGGDLVPKVSAGVNVPGANTVLKAAKAIGNVTGTGTASKALGNVLGINSTLKTMQKVGAAADAAKGFTPTFMQKLTGYYDPKTGMTVQGVGQLGLGAVDALLGGYLGMKQYGMAKKQLAFQQDAFNKNYEAQRSSYNRDIESRARDMASRDRLGDDFVNDYVKKHSI